MGEHTNASTNDMGQCNGTVMRNAENVHVAVPATGSLKTSEGSRWSRFRYLFPDAPASEYKKTLRELCMLSWPVMLYLTASTLFAVTSIIFTGHLGKEQIVAASLGQSIIHVCWRAPMIGFASGADTLFTQTFGSTNKKRVGIMLQRFLVMSMLMAVCCWGILLNTEGLLLLFGQDPGIAKLSGIYGIIYIAATPADIVVVQLIKYLESQGIVKPLLVITIAMGGLNILLHFVTVSALQYGLPGAVVAQVLTFNLGALMVTVYIYKRRLYKLTWPGWSWECLQEWGTIVKLSIGGMGITSIEWWCFEAGFFIAGLYGITEVGANAILFYIANVTWCLSTGVGIGGSILIGNSLGAKNPTKARITTCLCTIVTASFGVVYVAFYLSLKDVIGYIFTKDIDVIQLAASIIPIIAITEVFDSTNAAYFGILRGCGYQYIGAVVCLAGQGTGLGLGVVLMFTYDQGLKGLWIGSLTALIIENVMLVVFILCFINWDKEVIKAQKRAAVLPHTGTVDLFPCDREMELASNGGEELRACADDHPSPGGRNSPHDAGGRQSGSVVRTRHENPPHAEDGRDGEEETRPSFSSDDEEPNDAGAAEKEAAITVLTLGRLSGSQLIFRRGLALLVCITFFLASVYIAVYVVPAVRPTLAMGNNTTWYANSEHSYNGTGIVSSLSSGAVTITDL